MDVVELRKVKRPVGVGTWQAYVLGQDVYGTWLYTPPGSLYRGQDDEGVGVCDVGQDDTGAGRPVVQLIAPGAWWTPTWYPDTEARVVTVDVCTPPELTDQTWTYIDLELDPWVSNTGAVTTDDWDEFQIACTAGRIDTHEASQAITAVTTLEDLLRGGVEPFGVAGRERLTAAMRLPLPPLLVDDVLSARDAPLA
ncbi:hypothetical protein BH10ACT10_BH10ACT10_17350 [soil metagenome]